MNSRSRRLLMILLIGLAATMGLMAAIVGLRGFQIDTARSELRSRGVRCHIDARGDWWGTLPGCHSIGLTFARATDVRSTPETWTGGQLSDSDWQAALPLLRKLPPIRSVTIENAAIGSATLQTFDRLPELESISLAGCDINDEQIAQLAGISRLRSLNLSDTGVSGIGLKALRDLPHLTQLNLDGTPITIEGLDALATLEQLASISLSNTGLAESDVLRLEEALPGVMISDD